MFDSWGSTLVPTIIALHFTCHLGKPSTMALDALKQSAKWALDTIPKALGIQKIPALLPDRAAADELKLALPSYSQTDTYSCGAIAGWSVVEFLQTQRDFARFYRDCSPSVELGTSTTRLTGALWQHAINVRNHKDLSFTAIKKSISEGKPILVGIAAGALFDEDAGHWVVIYGYGANPNRVFISGRTIPGFSRQEMSWRDFKSAWSPVGNGLVCSAKVPTKVEKQGQQRSQ